MDISPLDIGTKNQNF